MESVLRPPGKKKKDPVALADNILNPGFAGPDTPSGLDVLRNSPTVPAIKRPVPESVQKPPPPTLVEGIQSDMRSGGLPAVVKRVGEPIVHSFNRDVMRPVSRGVVGLVAGTDTANALIPIPPGKNESLLDRYPDGVVKTPQEQALLEKINKNVVKPVSDAVTRRSDAAIPAAADAPAAQQKAEAAAASGNILRPGSGFTQSASGEWTAEGGRRTGIFTPTDAPVARAATPEEMAATAQRNASSPYNDPRNLNVGGPIHVNYLRPSGGAVFGRNDRAAALARNRADIQRGNILRLSGSQRTQMAQEGAQAREDNRFNTVMGLENRKLDQQDAAMQAQQDQQQTMLQTLAKQAEASGNAEASKWIMDQLGKAMDRGTPSGDKNKKTGDPIMRDYTPAELQDLSKAITGLAKPPNDQGAIYRAAGDNLRAFSRMSEADQAAAMKEPSVIASAQMIYNYYMKADDRTRANMDRSSRFPIVKQILGKA